MVPVVTGPLRPVAIWTAHYLATPSRVQLSLRGRLCFWGAGVKVPPATLEKATCSNSEEKEEIQVLWSADVEPATGGAR